MGVSQSRYWYNIVKGIGIAACQSGSLKWIDTVTRMSWIEFSSVVRLVLLID